MSEKYDLHRMTRLAIEHATTDEAMRASAALEDGDTDTLNSIALGVLDRADPELAAEVRREAAGRLPTHDEIMRDIQDIRDGKIDEKELRIATHKMIEGVIASGVTPEQMLRGPALTIILERARSFAGDAWFAPMLGAMKKYVEREGLTTRAVLAELGRLPRSEAS